jgi:phage-related protein
MREIRFYRTPSGNCPVEEFLDSLPGKVAQKVLWVMQIIEELEKVPKHYFKKLTGTDDLWEIRVQAGGNDYRILGFFIVGNVIILNHAFQKKSQRTPLKETKLAESRKRDYLNSN